MSRADLEAVMEQAALKVEAQSADGSPEWPTYLTRHQVAEILNIHFNTVGQYVKRGLITPREGRVEKFSTRDVMQLWRDRRDLVL